MSNKSQLIFATANAHKLEEVNQILQDTTYQVVSMREIGQTEEIEETGLTLEENAWIKANHLNQRFGLDCFSEDSGLEIDALDGQPGVHTARYAGEGRDQNANMDKVLAELANKDDRQAQFRTVIALIHKGEKMTFEGIIRGRIAMQKQGKGGFGYDPIFIPENYDYSFAQLPSPIKSHISHRARAMRKLLAYFEAQ